MDRYAKNPTIEAIIDFQAKLPDGVSAWQLHQCGAAERKQFPHESHFWDVENPNQSRRTGEHMPNGWIFRSADQKMVFQVHYRGFTFNQFPPYGTWEALRDEARRLWERYRETVKPLKVGRVAVRSLYRLDLRVPLENLKEYLSIFPEVGTGLEQAPGGFFLQLRFPYQDIRSALLLREAPVEMAGSTASAILLDLDLFCESDVPQDEEGIWRLVGVLHDRQTIAFEACITNRTRELLN
jgi:uncharacterized protein (TIGR04255 family)